MAAAKPNQKAGRDRKISVLIVDELPLIRHGLSRIIEIQTDMMLCGAETSLSEALKASKKLRPDLIITDFLLGDFSGFDQIRKFKSRRPQTSILILSVQDEYFYAERALRAGASGYIMKEAPLEDLVDAIRRVTNGGIYLSSRMASRIMHRLVGNRKPDEATPIDLLSDREMRVFELIGKGLGPAEIADMLRLSVKTIETYRTHIKRKLRLDNASALRQYAIQWFQNSMGR
jgi:DNA-binding NarL/FixJ family response regulator